MFMENICKDSDDCPSVWMSYEGDNIQLGQGAEALISDGEGRSDGGKN